MAARAPTHRTGLAFTKMHGLGNDFVVLDGVRQRIALDAEGVRRLADRRRGVGCDQVLVVEPARAGADFGYRVFNADGGEVEQCGNGARCIARFVHDSGLSEAAAITFATAGGTVRTELLAGGDVAVDMGVPRFSPADIPLQAEAEAEAYTLEVDGAEVGVGAVSLGNPHAVIGVDDVDAAPVTTLGPRIEQHPAFPRRVNVGFVQRLGRGRIRLRVWERGAGETLACGTGACAAVAVGRRRGELDERVTVALPGGELVIAWAGDDNPLWMAGPATTVFQGTLPR